MKAEVGVEILLYDSVSSVAFSICSLCSLFVPRCVLQRKQNFAKHADPTFVRFPVVASLYLCLAVSRSLQQ